MKTKTTITGVWLMCIAMLSAAPQEMPQRITMELVTTAPPSISLPNAASQATVPADVKIFASNYVCVINAKDETRLKQLIHPACLKALSDGPPAFMKRLLDKEFREAIPHSYQLNVLPVTLDETLFFSEMVSYPVRPTQQLVIAFDPAPNKSTTRIRYAVQTEGNWFLVLGCPKMQATAGSEQAKPAQQERPVKNQAALVELFQRYCDAIHRQDAIGAMAMQSKSLNKERDLKAPSAMKIGQHVVPLRFEVLKTTEADHTCSMNLRGWFKPVQGGDVAGEITVTFIQDDGGWKIQSTVLNLSSFDGNRPAGTDDAAQMMRAKQLVAGLDAPLRAELKQLLQQGQKVTAIKRCAKATGENLATALAMMQILEGKSQ